MLAKNLTILIYKNKVLLSSIDSLNFTNTNTRSFLSDSMLKSLELIDVKKEKLDQNLYFMKLTDKNVNEIKRKEGILLGFYTFNELVKINLSDETKKALEQNKDLINTLLVG